MTKDTLKTIQEIVALLNDDALFHNREISGDQDDFEMREKSFSTKYDLYECINMLIAIYDQCDEEITDPDISNLVMEIKDKIKSCLH